MRGISDKWKARVHMADLSVNGRPTEIHHKQIVCECVNWISPDKGKVIAGNFSARSQLCERQLLALSCLSVRSPVCVSICPHGTARLPLDGFS
jgi:hypothetical protein